MASFFMYSSKERLNMAEKTWLSDNKVVSREIDVYSKD